MLELQAQVQRAREAISTPALTQSAAFALGVVIGMAFWLVFVSNPPTLATFGTIIGAIAAGGLTSAMDLIASKANQKRHFAWYFIGLLVGVFVMIALIASSIQDPLVFPSSSASPSESLAPSPSS